MLATLPCIALLVKVSNEFDHNSGAYLQQAVEKQSKIVFFWSHENIWNLKTGELKVGRKWNLSETCTVWTHFLYQKTRAWIEG